ncbi:MAG: translation initiation factor IF-2 subunit gamma, partial [Ignisphaera sp.]|nr:translation initiation factor IF-2 subunit gamma [Ignisphaera sp.]
VNLPGTPPEKLVGGVVGGALIKGEIRVGDEVEIKPGAKVVVKSKINYVPLTTRITSIRYWNIESDFARPGGLVALGTNLDPSLTKSDSLRGQVLGHDVPDPVQDVRIQYSMLDKIIGFRGVVTAPPKLKPKDRLLLVIGTATVGAIIQRVTSDELEATLNEPVVVLKNSRATILMQIGGRYRLVGWGQVIS